jgi:hypothetical protein
MKTKTKKATQFPKDNPTPAPEPPPIPEPAKHAEDAGVAYNLALAAMDQCGCTWLEELKFLGRADTKPERAEAKARVKAAAAKWRASVKVARKLRRKALSASRKAAKLAEQARVANESRDEFLRGFAEESQLDHETAAQKWAEWGSNLSARARRRIEAIGVEAGKVEARNWLESQPLAR